jgi:Tfp pilus assembly pilus retraction ATPase PilT
VLKKKNKTFFFFFFFFFLDVVAGYNGTVFAYGQTGSGKTFTMMVDNIMTRQKEKATHKSILK